MVIDFLQEGRRIPGNDSYSQVERGVDRMDPLSVFSIVLTELDSRDGEIDSKADGEDTFLNYDILAFLREADLLDNGQVDFSISGNPYLGKYVEALKRNGINLFDMYATLDSNNRQPSSPKGHHRFPVPFGTTSRPLRGDTPRIDTVDPKISYVEPPIIGDGSSIVPTGVKTRLTSDFGPRTHPVTGEQGKMHYGIDIATPQGTPLCSPGDGTVTFAGQRGGYGGLVIIKLSSGKEIRLAHLSEICVSVGQKVQAGQQIALSGGAAGTKGAGTSTGPHLHFEYRVDGKAVDPLKFGWGQFFGIA